MLGAIPDQHPSHAASAGFGAAPRIVHLVSVSRGKRSQAAARSEGLQAVAKASGMRKAVRRAVPKG
jgi:hypothetical protein